MTRECGKHVTIGEARRAVQQRQWSNLVRWICQQQAAGSTPQALVERLAA
jgi:3-methyladenine DNA glycosylase/8-oxoguanine DNA glycosylase